MLSSILDDMPESMIEFGFYGEVDENPKLSRIDDESKASAFLRLLDASIGTVERATFPTDLGDALDQILRVAPKLSEAQPFRRLAALTRK